MSSRWVQLVTFFGALASTRAAAEEPVQVAVMPMQMEGEVSTEDQALLQQALLDALAGDGVTLREVPTRCDDAACVAELAGSEGVHRVVDAQLSYSMNVYQLTLSVLDETGTPLQSVSLSCEICTVPDVTARFAEAADELHARLVEAPARTAVLVVDSTPPGATVWVDDVEIGVTPIEAEVEPGSHELRVERAGHVGQRASFEGVAGERATFTMRLDASDEDDTPSPSRRAMWIAGLGLIGAGASGTIGGTVLMVLDSRPVQRKCVGDNVDINGECKFLHDTKLGGVISLAVGGAALATGIALAVVGRKGARPSKAKEQARRWRVAPTAYGVGVWF